MMSRKTQYGWMAVGAMLCLLGIGIAVKMRDTNKVVAQDATGYSPSAPVAKEDDKKPEPIPAPPASSVKLEFVEPLPVGPARIPEPPPVPQPPSVTVMPLPPLPPPTAPVEPAPPSPVAPVVVVPTAPPTPAPPSIPEGPVGVNPVPEPLLTPERNPPQSPAPLPTVLTPTPPKVTWSNPKVSDPPSTPMSPSAILPVSATAKNETAPGEPPLANVAGPLQVYEVHTDMTVQQIALKTLGATERWQEIQRLNPSLKTGEPIIKGTLVRVPADAAVAPLDEVESVKPLPSMRPKSAPAVPKKVLPLTGTYQCTLDDKHELTLPKALRDQLGNCDTILVSPGPDQCLWITNHAHIERLAERLEVSPAKEMDVRVFKRLYYAQTEKSPLTAEGKISVSDKLVTFAGLRQDVVLIGIDDHFELWDATKWRTYTQQKSAEARSVMEHD